MEPQVVINALFGLLVGLLAWLLRELWGTVKDQAKEIANGKEALAAAELKMAEHYMPRPELEKTFARLFDGMDDIKKEVTHISRNHVSVKLLSDFLAKKEGGH